MYPSRLRTPNFGRVSHGGNIHSFARSLGVRPEQVLDFSASINPLGIPPSAAVAYRRAQSRINTYPEPYAETLAAELANIHLIHPSSILIGNGSTQLIYLLARTLAVKQVLLIAPLFTEYATAFRLVGSQVEHLRLHPPTFRLSLQRLRTALGKGYDAVVLTNPNSPTGVLLSRSEVEKIAVLCRRTGTALIVDETFIDWLEEHSLTQWATQRPGVIVLRSLTKFFALAGLRVGYLVAYRPIVRKLRTSLEPWSVNSVAQEVARACLRDPSFAERSRTFLAKERRWLHTQLNAFAQLQPVPSQANFILVRITGKNPSAAHLAQALAQQGILIRVCSNFVGLGAQFFRVAVRTRGENRRLLAALKEELGGSLL